MKNYLLFFSFLGLFISCTSNDDTATYSEDSSLLTNVNIEEYTVTFGDSISHLYTLSNNKFVTYSLPSSNWSGNFSYNTNGVLDEYEHYVNGSFSYKDTYSYNSTGDLLEIQTNGANGNTISKISFTHTADTVFATTYEANSSGSLEAVINYKVVFDAFDNREYVEVDYSGLTGTKQFFSVISNNLSSRQMISIYDPVLNGTSMSYLHDNTITNTLNYIYMNMFDNNKRNLYLSDLSLETTSQLNDFDNFRLDEGVITDITVDYGAFYTGAYFGVSSLSNNNFLSEISFTTVVENSLFSEVKHEFEFTQQSN